MDTCVTCDHHKKVMKDKFERFTRAKVEYEAVICEHEEMRDPVTGEPRECTDIRQNRPKCLKHSGRGEKFDSEE